MLVSGNIKSEEVKVKKNLFGVHGPFECPVYKYGARTDRFFVFFANLRCPEEKPLPAFWGLRGVALLCNTE